MVCVELCRNNFVPILLSYFFHAFLYFITLGVLNLVGGERRVQVNLLRKLPRFFQKFTHFQVD